MYTRHRIKLLSDSEIDAIYSLPLFNEVERSLYFEFTDREIGIARKYRTIKSQVCFMLSLGYFKAKQQFYTFDLSLDSFLIDAQYILEKYFDKNNITLSGQVDYKTYQKQKNDILVLLDYQDWSSKYKPQIESYICELLRYYPKSHSANRDDGISQLNIIRADQKDFQYTAVRDEVEKAQGIVGLYEFSKTFIPKLQLSKNAVRYYADIAEQYASSRLRRLSLPQQWLHAICFVYHRYQQIMDNLIISFMYHVRNIMDSGKAYAATAMIEHASRIVADFPKLAQFLQWFPRRDKELTHEELNPDSL